MMFNFASSQRALRIGFRLWLMFDVYVVCFINQKFRGESIQSIIHLANEKQSPTANDALCTKNVTRYSRPQVSTLRNRLQGRD